MHREYFSAKEALALLGAEVSPIGLDAPFPAGSRGRVIRVRKDHATGFRIQVKWEPLSNAQYVEFSKAEFQRFLRIGPSRP